MSAKSTADRYGSVAIAIHWVTAVAILALIVAGVSAANTSDDATKAALLRVHVPLGVGVFALTIFRIAWWFMDRRPAAPGDLPRWQVSVEAIVRVLLYALVLLLGASGIAMIALSGAGTILFGGEARALPDFWNYPPMRAHFFAVISLAALLCLHIAAALYHHVIQRNGLLTRMGVGKAA
jgi:cytochrome b561